MLLEKLWLDSKARQILKWEKFFFSDLGGGIGVPPTAGCGGLQYPFWA